MSAAGAAGAHAALRRVFSRFAETGAPAYLHTDGDLSFKALHAAALALSAQLAAAGRGPVLIYGHKHRRFLIAYWAALLSGRAAVPVETGTSPERIRQIARTCGAGLALIACPRHAGDELAGVPAWPVSEQGCSRGSAAADHGVSGAAAALPPEAADGAAAYVLFSSGTTGRPKGIAVSYANLADFVDWAQDLLAGMDPARCISGNVRHCFDVSLFEFWFSWLSLRPISALDHRDLFNTAMLIERYRNHRLGTWVSTPALALHWTRDKAFNAAALPDLKSMVFCGEVLSKSLVETLWDRFPGLRIFNTYGPTECTVAVTSVEICRAHLEAPQPLPIGRARRGTRLATAAGGGAGPGELTITGRSVGLGYLGDPDRQALAFPGSSSYRTGDWARKMGDLWYFEGRKDREIKLHGHRINLADVETALQSVAGIEEAVVDLHPAKRGLRAFVLGGSAPDALRSAAQQLSRQLPAYMVPRFWFGTDAFQINANCKLDRRRFVTELSSRRPFVYSAESSAAPVPPVPAG
ncbi:AMP-binding protein [Leisingera thetidis]|uniref:AMP-binding protein n=1 Tax=Leisingera thetidis TaxID=2930199 RepID=UPI0021F6ECE4|nr:AMP-binding protein [Leisingera thetidis]